MGKKLKKDELENLTGAALEQVLKEAAARGVSRAERREQRVNYIYGELGRVNGKPPFSKKYIREHIVS